MSDDNRRESGSQPEAQRPPEAMTTLRPFGAQSTLGLVMSDLSASNLPVSSQAETVVDGSRRPTPPAVDTAPPRSATGDLEMEETLGQGGYGDVWLGRQVELDRLVAVKCLRADRMARAGRAQRSQMEALFRQEALTSAALEHPNIVPVYQLSRAVDGRALLAMKRVQGRPWNDLIYEELDLPEDEFLARHLPILVAVAQAVAYAHSQGVLHRDLKPHQVIVGDFGEVMLTDWGLAARFDPPQEPEALEPGVPFSGVDEGTSPGMAGTPAFMAPEQTKRLPEDLGPWTDVFLLGGCLYYLLTGLPPHEGDTASEALAGAKAGKVVPPEERVPGRRVPEELGELAREMLHRDPRKRHPATAAAFVERLQEYLSGVSRRRRSREITEALADAADNAGYKELSHVSAEIRRAQALWPENPQAEELHLGTLRRWAEVALGRGDLKLARVQAEQLPPGPERVELLEGVRSAMAARRAASRQRRLALRALALLALILVAGAVKYQLDQRRARAELTEQRDAAVAARAETEGLMTFMLDDLWQQLSAMQRVDVLEPVARRAQEVYAGRTPAPGDAAPPPAERLNRGKVFSTVAQVLAFQGAQQEAVEAYRRADEVFRGLLGEEVPAEIVAEARSASLETRIVLGLALSDLGRKDEALEVLEEAQQEAAAAQAGAEGEELVTLRSLEASAWDFWGIVVYDQGDLERAEEAFSRAVTILEELRAAHPEDFGLDSIQAASMRWAVTLNETGRHQEALEELDRTSPFLTDGSLPTMLAASPASSFSVLTRGEILLNLGRRGEAVELLEQSIPHLLRHLEQDPQNNETRYGAANLTSLLAQAYAAQGNEAAARRAYEEVLALIEPVRGETDLVYLDDLTVRALLRLGRLEEARPLAQELLEKDWRHRGFRELVEGYGISGE